MNINWPKLALFVGRKKYKTLLPSTSLSSVECEHSPSAKKTHKLTIIIAWIGDIFLNVQIDFFRKEGAADGREAGACRYCQKHSPLTLSPSLLRYFTWESFRQSGWSATEKQVCNYLWRSCLILMHRSKRGHFHTGAMEQIQG